MSYRSNAARYVSAGHQTRDFTVTLANGETGRIAAAGLPDARREAARWAKVRKSVVSDIDDFDWEEHEALLRDCGQDDGEVGLSYLNGEDDL